ncbi:hypothetical protein Scep_020774 [Stephania cephalantha]|uniref:Pentatricopeptide repeat-containing protein n=1 Tax=Stephania cephalantha TaxID=152367 RepID=A0AAP0IDH1_9MAGN
MSSLSSLNRILAGIRAKKKSKTRPCLVQSVLALSSQKKLKQAVESLGLLSRQGLRLQSRTLAFLLKQCATSKSLREGKWLHLYLKLTGRKRPTTYLSNHLINMYSNCGRDVEARQLFDRMPAKNVFSWNNMLAGYVKVGMLKRAQRLFDEMPERDVVSWNTMVVAFARNGCFDEALSLYAQLRGSSIGFNQFSFAGVLIVCVKLKDLGLTLQVHAQVLVAGFMPNVVLSSSIVDAYARCSVLCDARKLFDEMPVRDVLAWTVLVSGYAKGGDMVSARRLFSEMPEPNPVSWTALIAGYARNGLEGEALVLFREMITNGIEPNQFTFSSSLCACAGIDSLLHGKQIHARLIRTCFNPNTIVVSSLIDVYSKCGRLDIGRQVFDLLGRKKQDVMVWNTMISALAQHGLGEEALQFLGNMVREGVKPDRITLGVILHVCHHSGLVEAGINIFKSMIRDHRVVANQEHYACLVDLFGRYGQF